MTNGDVVGIAIPLVGEEFQVSRFSLKGYSKSINALTIHSNNNNSIKTLTIKKRLLWMKLLMH